MKHRLSLAALAIALAAASMGSPPAEAQTSKEPIPDSCLFSTPEAMDKLDRDDPSLYGLSADSIKLNTAYQRDLEEIAKEDPPLTDDVAGPVEERPEAPVPDGAVVWSSMALTPADAQRLGDMSDMYENNVVEVSKEAERLAGEQFVGMTWSYIDGFVISVTGKVDMASQMASQFPRVPIKVHQGLVPKDIADTNLKVLAELGHSGFIASSDESCGLTFVAFADEPLSKDRLDQILTPGSYQVVDLGYFGGSKPTLTAGKAERKQTLSGGLKIWTNGGGTGNWCTSNVVARKGTSEQWLITAGHCTQGFTIIGSAENVSVLVGSNWYQGFNTSSTNRISFGTTQYMLFGGNHDIQVIQLNGTRTPSHLAHRRVYQPYPGSPYYDEYEDPLWWYWNLGFEHSGIRVCQSGYTMGGADCGQIHSTNNTYGLTIVDDGAPFDATMTNIRRSLAMDVCNGDSGGTVWAANNDDNIAGIVHARSNHQFNRTREGRVFACGDAYYTGISSLLNIGLAAPWGMS